MIEKEVTQLIHTRQGMPDITVNTDQLFKGQQVIRRKTWKHIKEHVRSWADIGAQDTSHNNKIVT